MKTMATTKEEFEEAFTILSHFERQIIDAEDFSWDYITDRVTPSKPTLWRNTDFRDEFNRIKKLVKGYRDDDKEYDIEVIQKSLLELTNEKLTERVAQLEKDLDRERERLAYAAMVARRHNIDPAQFMEQSPLLEAIHVKKIKSNTEKVKIPKAKITPIRSKKAARQQEA